MAEDMINMLDSSEEYEEPMLVDLEDLEPMDDCCTGGGTVPK